MSDAQAMLPFLPSQWRGLPSAPALYDPNIGWLDYAGLARAIAAAQPLLAARRKALVFCLAENRAASIIAYLAAAQSGHALALLSMALPRIAALIATYQPKFIIAPSSFEAPEGYRRQDEAVPQVAFWRRATAETPVENRMEIHPDLFLLLLTSGSTGGGKFVRLSYRNVAANTQAIVASLGLTASERALLHLPLSYSFGLSVLHMQLAAGGGVALTDLGMMERDFWELTRQSKATLFPGVPYHYQMLLRLGLTRLQAPNLIAFLQAGGRLDPELARQFLAEIRTRQGRLFIMYGQTEAAPRMSCFAAHERPEKIGSVGQALPGGKLSIHDGEIVYEGANVMLGYCTGLADLALGDTRQGHLATGDLGSLDNEGFLTITGRKQRFAKLYGMRIALDEIEKTAERIAPAAAVEGKEQILIATTAQDAATRDAMSQAVLASTSLAPGWFAIRPVAAFPYRANGKLDYPALMDMLK